MRYLIILLLGITLLSCEEDENCGTEDSRTFVVIRFFDLETQDPKVVGFAFNVDGSPYSWTFLADTTITPAVLDGETIITPADTTIVSDSTFVILPLNPNQNTTTFRFESDTSNHVMELSYKVSYSIYDPACEPALQFNKIDTVQQSFDSTVVVGPATIRQLDTNVEVYL